MLKGNRKPSLQVFHCFSANRACLESGGAATCVKVKDRQHTLKVHKAVEGQEFLSTRHNQFSTAINVINLTLVFLFMSMATNGDEGNHLFGLAVD